MNNNLPLKGFRMPAEWELQESVWVAWPYNKNDWPELFENIPSIVSQIISELSKSQKVNLLIKNYKDKKIIINLLNKFSHKLSNINFHSISTNRIWLRDSGPIFLINDKTKKKIMLNFKFNAWSKYKDYRKDNNINNKLSKLIKIKKINPLVKINKKHKQLVLEGGAIDVNGKGSILLTKECLLSKVQERNPGITKSILEKTLMKYLNVKNFVWLNKGIKGDDTHGHIDDISRFVSKNTIMTAVESNKRDKNYKNLKENLKILRNAKNINKKKFKIIKIPMPKTMYIKNTRVPASYLNFYMANKIVLLPIFSDVNDKKVILIFKKFFKTKKIVPIDCTELVWGFGAIHCMTQPEPKV
tara:strand:+ start:1193 stop:2263 length:1071 start_codon:yes stop_codon:yes gene_type:complete